jgi:hypothetical protein
MPSIRDFSGGVVNQELLGKDSGAGIIIDANNVLSSWGGELRKRTGTRIITQLEKKSRIIPYRLPNNDDALLLFTDGNVKGYEITDSGLVPLGVKQADSGMSFPLNNWTSNKNGSWTVSSNIVASSGSIYNIFNKDSYYNFGVSDISGNRYISFYNDSPFWIKSINIRFINHLSSITYDYYYGAVFQWSDDGNTWNPVTTTETITYDNQHWKFSDSNVAIFSISPSVSKAHKYWRILFSGRNGTAQMNILVTDVLCEGEMSKIFDFSTNFNDSDLDKISFAQRNEEMYFACRKKTPMFYKPYETEVFGNYMPKDADLVVWEKNGKPSCVSLYQNRLAFAGFENFKNRVILSEFGNFDNFTVKVSDVKSTDSISADCVELKAPIDNLWAGNNALYVLSSDGVSMLDAQGGVVATDQVNFKLRNREPANGMMPTTKDDIMIYLGNDRRKIFITDYDFVVQRFKAKDLSVGYNGFLTSRIVALHYASRKCSLIYGYKDDGNMLAILFDVDMQKNALFPLDIGGDIKDMQVFKSGDKFRVLMVTQIDDRWYLIEKNEQPEYAVMDFMSDKEKAAYTDAVMRNGMYLDYMTRHYFSSSVTEISNLPYGNNQMVAVFADNVYVGEKVCQNGKIKLDTAAKEFVLGYNYDAYVAIKLATPYANIKYPKEVSTYLINTGYLEIGNSFDNLEPILNNMKDKLDLFDSPKFVNGEYTKTMDKLENSPYIILRSNLPMPFMITGLDFKVDYSNYQGGI